MEEDLLNRRSSGGLSGSVASARSWLEHRSRLGPYANSIRLGWSIAGIWDCLREQKYQEARARAALAIAALDQQSLDTGSWLIAQEVMLEPPPPLSTFTARRVQQLDPLESFHSKLLDPRMADLLLHRVKEVEGYMEAKKKLGKARVSDPPVEARRLPQVLPTRKAEKAKKGSLTSLEKAPPGARGSKSSLSRVDRQVAPVCLSLAMPAALRSLCWALLVVSVTACRFFWLLEPIGSKLSVSGLLGSASSLSHSGCAGACASSLGIRADPLFETSCVCGPDLAAPFSSSFAEPLEAGLDRTFAPLRVRTVLLRGCHSPLGHLRTAVFFTPDFRVRVPRFYQVRPPSL